MARMIDADALHEEMCERMTRFHALGKARVAQDYNFVATVVGTAPTVDAVPVVRCRECKYYKPNEYECGCDCPAGLPYVKADDFCSYGERRDQSADVRKMEQSAAPGKMGGNTDD